MWIRRLRLAQFRNHTDTDLQLTSGVNVIVGPNGAGKTALLEAVSVVCDGQSFRSSHESALMRDGARAGRVCATIDRNAREIEVGIGLGEYPNRYMLNGAPRSSSGEVIGQGRCVVFSPDDLELVKGGPSLRRKYLDDTLVGLAPRHYTERSEWERVLKQRNSLLKSLRSVRGSTPAALDTWTHLAAEKGAALTAARIELVDRIRDPIQRVGDDLGLPPVEIGYASDWVGDTDAGCVTGIGPESDLAAGLEARLLSAYSDVADRERERGVSLAGPHLDDLYIRVEARDSRTRASQGEQRALALCLRIARLEMIEMALGEPPVLLLDDVFSELDPERRRFLVEQLPDSQTLVTATALAGASGPPAELADVVLNSSGDMSVIRVEAGKVMQ